MTARTRTIRIDVAASVYEELENHADQQDVGTATLVRCILIKWTNEHPLPPSDAEGV